MDKQTRPHAHSDFISADRFEWDWTPGTRRGLALKKMSAQTKKDFFELLATVLSPAGLTAVKDVMVREAALAKIERNQGYRDPDLYFVMIFGEPAKEQLWGLRFEGHHLSLNVTFKGDEMISTTPFMMGANPAAHGNIKEPKAARLAKDLFASLTDAQKTKAVSSPFLTGTGHGGIEWNASGGHFSFAPNKRMGAPRPEGLLASELNPVQRELLRNLISDFFLCAEKKIGSAQLDRLSGTFDQVRIMGRGKFLDGESYLYRLQGPHFLIEANAVQESGNHLHLVWRDFENDFGLKLTEGAASAP